MKPITRAIGAAEFGNDSAAQDSNALPVQLHVIHDLGGGSATWLRDFCVADTRRKNLVLKSFTQNNAMGCGVALYAHVLDEAPLQMWHFFDQIQATVVTHAEYSRVLNEIIMQYRVDALLVSSVGFSEDSVHIGPLFDQFPLTLDSGRRTEAVGPLFYNQQTDSEKVWALPPLFSHKTDPTIESREDDFLYPLLTYEYYGREYRWQLIQLFSFSGGQEPDDSGKRRFTLFPFYFQQRSPDPNENYTALFPIYGHLNNRVFRDKIFFVLFPIYGQTQKRDVVTDNYLYPFFHLRHGDGLQGWQFWPLVGSEHKDVTTKTNGFGDIETVAGHDNFFALWPFYFKSTAGIVMKQCRDLIAGSRETGLLP